MDEEQQKSNQLGRDFKKVQEIKSLYQMKALLYNDTFYVRHDVKYIKSRNS